MKAPVAVVFASVLLLAACSEAPKEQVAQDEIRSIPRPPAARAGLPKVVDANIRLGIGSAGFAFSPDGRVLVSDFTVPAAPEFPTCGFATGWAVRVLRHEGLGKDQPNGTPVFDDSVWSPPIPIALNDLFGTNGITGHVALAMTIAPEMQTLPFPYPSNEKGELDANGQYETYDLVIVTQPWDIHGIVPELGCNQNVPSLTVENRLLEKRLKVVVENARTPLATVKHAKLDDGYRQLGWRNGDNGVQSLIGIEPTMSFDGRVVIWQGSPLNNDPAVDRDHTRHGSGVVMYSFNENPADRDGWSMPRSINQMYFEHRDVMIDGVRFADRYPLAAQPLRSADGTVLARSDLYRGAYPWANLDISELYHTSTQFQTSNLQNGFSVIGRDTGWALRLIDGPLNPDRQVSRKVIFQGTGVAPGLWAPGRDMVEPPLPYTRPERVAPIFGMSIGNYGEVSFDEYMDRDYVVALEMNEMLAFNRFQNIAYFTFDVTRTPDISGRFNSALLEGAQFPLEAGLQDINQGIVGQAIYFDGAAAVRIPDDPGLDETSDAFTVELFVKRLVAGAGPEALVERSGAFGLHVDPAGNVRGSVYVAGVRYETPAVPTNVDAGAYTHLALTYDAERGALILYEDGAPIAETTAGGLVDPGGDVVVGPGTFGTGTMWIDELKISRVARTAAELRRAAYVVETPAPRAPSPALPLGLDTDEFIVPLDNPMTKEKIALGRRLFEDPILSIDHSKSCASCHIEGLAFTDGLPTAIGLGGKVLARNTPTTLNRGFSTDQFWDSRAPTLEIQASMPIEHPDEMGLPLDEAIERLKADDSYVREFVAAFGEGPSLDTLQKAIASYERATVTGGSRVDHFEAGNRLALTLPEIRGWILFHGKARCVACHDGSNYSDEMLHVALDHSPDLGAYAVTGREQDREMFKTPTLRNIGFTGPYFHDGSAVTLEDVVERYDSGGDRAHDRRDAEIFPLGLTDEEKSDLVAFLHALASPIEILQP